MPPANCFAGDFPFSRPWMGLVVNVFKLLLDYMCVYLCTGEVRMAQHLLDGAQVGAVFKQVRSEGMAQRVRRYVLLYVGLDMS